MQKKKVLKELIKIFTIFLTTIFAVFLFFCNILYSFSFLKDSIFSRERAAAFIKNQTPQSQSAANIKSKKVGFFDKQTQHIYIKSNDGLMLHAALKMQEKASSEFAILCHGYSGDYKSTDKYAKEFYSMGYNILSPDARAHGKSEGKTIGMGYLEKEDILLWINKILKSDPDAQIVLFGVSMGGATVLMTSGEEALPKNVKAIISDCAYTSVYDEIDYLIKNITSIRSSTLTDGLSIISKIRGDYSFSEASCVKAVKNSHTPTLFIHGGKDTFVPFSMLDIIYKNAECPKEKLIIENAHHGSSAQTDPQRYFSEIKKFLSKYIK